MHNDYDPTNISKMSHRLRPIDGKRTRDKYDEEEDLIVSFIDAAISCVNQESMNEYREKARMRIRNLAANLRHAEQRINEFDAKGATVKNNQDLVKEAKKLIAEYIDSKVNAKTFNDLCHLSDKVKVIDDFLRKHLKPEIKTQAIYGITDGIGLTTSDLTHEDSDLSRRQQKSSGKRFEYKILSADTLPELADEIEVYLNNGWQLCGSFCFYNSKIGERVCQCMMRITDEASDE
jgi:hypothetical protein